MLLQLNIVPVGKKKAQNIPILTKLKFKSSDNISFSINGGDYQQAGTQVLVDAGTYHLSFKRNSDVVADHFPVNTESGSITIQLK
jgi:hypothetical protein